MNHHVVERPRLLVGVPVGPDGPGAVVPAAGPPHRPGQRFDHPDAVARGPRHRGEQVGRPLAGELEGAEVALVDDAGVGQHGELVPRGGELAVRRVSDPECAAQRGGAGHRQRADDRRSAGVHLAGERAGGRLGEVARHGAADVRVQGDRAGVPQVAVEDGVRQGQAAVGGHPDDVGPEGGPVGHAGVADDADRAARLDQGLVALQVRRAVVVAEGQVAVRPQHAAGKVQPGGGQAVGVQPQFRPAG